jgi:hypothetical protein
LTNVSLLSSDDEGHPLDSALFKTKTKAVVNHQHQLIQEQKQVKRKQKQVKPSPSHDDTNLVQHLPQKMSKRMSKEFHSKPAPKAAHSGIPKAADADSYSSCSDSSDATLASVGSSYQASLPDFVPHPSLDPPPGNADVDSDEGLDVIIPVQTHRQEYSKSSDVYDTLSTDPCT